MDARWYRREYECEFEDPVSQVFDPDLIETAVTREVKPLFPRRGPERRG
jgi:hypothetical protein